MIKQLELDLLGDDRATQPEKPPDNVVTLSQWKQSKIKFKDSISPGDSPIFFRPPAENVLCDGCDQETSPDRGAYSRDKISDLWPGRYLGRIDFCRKCVNVPAIRLLGRRVKAARIQSGQEVETISAGSPILNARFINQLESGGCPEDLWDDDRFHQQVYVLLCALSVSTWSLYHGLWELHRSRQTEK